MIYPKNFEHKISFNEIRDLLKSHCQSNMGKERVDAIAFLTKAEEINLQQRHTYEFLRLMEVEDEVPPMDFFDLREAFHRIRIGGTYLEESQMWDLKRSLDTLHAFIAIIRKGERKEGFGKHEEVAQAEKEGRYEGSNYPTLSLLSDGVFTFHNVTRRIEQILDKYGKVKDDASPDLARIRHELRKAEGSVGRTLHKILSTVKAEGLVEQDVNPTFRDGRLVIPVSPGLKRRIKGIVHDESATGKTVFIEPAEVVEANNMIRELEADEKREVIRILQEFTGLLRPNVTELLRGWQFLADLEFIRAKAELSKQIQGITPNVESSALIDWTLAQHPLLALNLKAHGRKVVPLDIALGTRKNLGKDQRILIISGPNAGGKSVCLKTVALLQYMLQCGLPVPMGEHSRCGVFQSLFIDIGDEQSIDDDLSTYSSHLLNMKHMMRSSSNSSLLLIDEFGGGTEPAIGGAMAEAILGRFHQKGTFGVITTHYQNLKHFADGHEGVVNGAMLYDRHEMQPLFQLQIGNPGSSFAVEIARKIGIPEDVISEASQIVGQDYIDADKYLQDIVRDKRYWEGKRQNIHQQEKQMQQTIARYEDEVTDLHSQRRDIIKKAREEALHIIADANARIEATIREIRETQAEKERTREARMELQEFKDALADESTMNGNDNAEVIEKKMRQIEERRKRKAERKAKKAKDAQNAAASNPDGGAAANGGNGGNPYPLGTLGSSNSSNSTSLGNASSSLHFASQQKLGEAGVRLSSFVRIKGQTSVGKLESIDGKRATVVFGTMRTIVDVKRLLPAEAPKQESIQQVATYLSKETREDMHQRRINFHQDLDVRGMRGDEALNAVSYYIDDAILVGASRVRILHGTGNGILRTLIRQYLKTVASITSARDEHVQFGGAGITVVEFK